MSLTREDLFQFLQDELGVDTNDVQDDTLLFSSRLVDSFSMVDLIMFLEKRGRFKMKPTEVHLENLDSVERILNFYARQATSSQG